MKKPFYPSVFLSLALLLLANCTSGPAVATETQLPTEQRQPPTQEPSAAPPTSPQPGSGEFTEEAEQSPTEGPIQQSGCEYTDSQPGPNEIVITGAVCMRYTIGRTSVDEWAGEGYYGIEMDIEADPADPFNADGVIIWLPPGTQPGTYAIGTHEYEEGVEKITAGFSYYENGTRHGFESIDGSLQLTATGAPYSGAVYSGYFTFTAAAINFPGQVNLSMTITVTGNFDFQDD